MPAPVFASASQLTEPQSVKLPASESIVAAPLKLISPVIVLQPLALLIAPVEDTPVPTIQISSAVVMPPITYQRSSTNDTLSMPEIHTFRHSRAKSAI